MESRRPANEADVRRYKEQIEKLYSDLQVTTHEKDNAIMKLEHFKTEMNDLKESSYEASKLRMRVQELQQVCNICTVFI